ncbi:MAG TPA: hypothetical protein PLS49_05445, partial [Candidatus Woesebacteria bacterium]|nr:hypothetical protein [Candidatus Woesebacteria bacterium]
MKLENGIFQPNNRDIDTISEVNYKIGTQAGAFETPLVNTQSLIKESFRITSQTAKDIAAEVTSRGIYKNKLAHPEIKQLLYELPYGSLLQIAFPSLKGNEFIPTYGVKVPYASTQENIDNAHMGLLLAADVRGLTPERKLTRAPRNISQVYSTQVMPDFNPQLAEQAEYRDSITENVQFALAAGLNRVHSKLGMNAIETTTKQTHSPIDKTHNSATFELLSYAARNVQSTDPERLVHKNHYLGEEGQHLFTLMQQEFATMSPLIEEVGTPHLYTYPFPLRLIDVNMNELSSNLPTQVQFTRNTIIPDTDGFYPIDLSAVAAIQDVRVRGLYALGNDTG